MDPLFVVGVFLFGLAMLITSLAAIIWAVRRNP